MNLRAKLAYIVLGSMCTLAGILFATMSPLSAKSEKEDTQIFDTIACKQLLIYDDEKMYASFGVLDGNEAIGANMMIFDPTKPSNVKFLITGDQLSFVENMSPYSDSDTLRLATLFVDNGEGRLALISNDGNAVAINQGTGEYSILFQDKGVNKCILGIDSKTRNGQILLTKSDGTPYFVRNGEGVPLGN